MPSQAPECTQHSPSTLSLCLLDADCGPETHPKDMGCILYGWYCSLCLIKTALGQADISSLSHVRRQPTVWTFCLCRAHSNERCSETNQGALLTFPPCFPSEMGEVQRPG